MQKKEQNVRNNLTQTKKERKAHRQQATTTIINDIEVLKIQQQKQNIKIAFQKIRDGNTKKAMKQLTSLGIAPITPQTLTKFKEKLVEGPMVQKIECISEKLICDPDTLQESISIMDKTSKGGPDYFHVSFLKTLWEHQCSNNFKKALRKLINCIINATLSDETMYYINTLRGILFNKPDPTDIRPILIG
jgi:hypothetical protein